MRHCVYFTKGLEALIRQQIANYCKVISMFVVFRTVYKLGRNSVALHFALRVHIARKFWHTTTILKLVKFGPCGVLQMIFGDSHVVSSHVFALRDSIVWICLHVVNLCVKSMFYGYRIRNGRHSCFFHSYLKVCIKYVIKFSVSVRKRITSSVRHT